MPRLINARFLVLTTLLAHAALSYGQGIYSFEDSSGTLHLSGTPADDRYGSLIESGPTRPESAARGNRPLTADEEVAYPALGAVRRSARRHGIPEGLLRAVIQVESGNVHSRSSRKGAVGLMQVMPATGARYGISDLWVLEQNIEAGTRYLRDLLILFSDEVPLALAAYNAGEGAVIRHGRKIPPYPETQRYVKAVLELYNAFAGNAAGHRESDADVPVVAGGTNSNRQSR